jgi:hypothetical protein
VAADGDLAEVHNEVGSLGETEKQPAPVERRQVDRRRQEATLVADDPDLDAGDGPEVDDENRESQPLSKRKRYRACSTSRYGQVAPLTMIVFPKNSGFQIGETSVGSSVSPMYGPVISSK